MAVNFSRLFVKFLSGVRVKKSCEYNINQFRSLIFYKITYNMPRKRKQSPTNAAIVAAPDEPDFDKNETESVESGVADSKKSKRKATKKEIKNGTVAPTPAEKPAKTKAAKTDKKAAKANEDPVEEEPEKDEIADVKTNGTAEKKAKATKTKKEAAPKKESVKIKVAAKKPKETKRKEPVTADENAEPAEAAATRPKRGRLPKKEDGDADKEVAKSKKNPVETDYNDIDFTCNKKNALGKEFNVKISSWNVDGIRAWLKKDGSQFIDQEKPDILCIQEIKCSQDKLPEELEDIEGYEKFWCPAEKEGYSGVGLLTKIKPIDVQYGIGDEEQDAEGRTITAEFDKFFVVSVYVPNAGQKLVTLSKRLEWNELFKKYIKDLDSKKPVVICGDLNVAHNEIDLANPKTNTKNAGFTKEEREGMTEFLQEGFIDTFRHLYPDKEGAYSFWTYLRNSRSKNVGWRLDYFLVSERIADNVCDNVMRPDVLGSDHCPITLFINI